MKKNLLLLFILILGNHAFAQTLQFNIPTTNKKVYSIVRYNNTIYIGGDFDTVGTTARRNLAALDASTGAVLPWNPDPNSKVDNLLISGNKLIAEGSFNTVSALTRNGIAVFDMGTGSLLNSSIAVGAYSYGGIAQQGNYIYYSGTGTMGITMKRFDINTLQDDLVWEGNETMNGDVRSLTTLGNYVYAGGWFYINNFFNIEQLCRYNISTGALDTSFHFTFASGGYVTKILGHDNGKLYVTGNYASINGITRKGIAEIDPAGSGSLTTKNIYCSNQYNWGLAAQGNTIWIGGNSVVIGGMNRYSIAQVDLHTGFTTCWFTQALSGNVYHYSIFPTHDTVYVAPQSSGLRSFTGNPGYVNLGNDTVLCPGGSITLTAPAGLSGYYWSNGATTQSITVNTPGNYWVSATDPGGCLMSGTRVVTACTGISETGFLTDIKIYPTISDGHYEVEFLPFPEKGMLEICDVSGKLIFNKVIPVGEEKVTFDISDSDTGMYFLRLTCGNKQSGTYKLVKNLD